MQKKLIKLKLITNPKLTCTQFTKKLEESWLKNNDSCSKNERMKHTIIMKSKVFKQICLHIFILAILKYNNHN
jgi:hypothetical protein